MEGCPAALGGVARTAGRVEVVGGRRNRRGRRTGPGWLCGVDRVETDRAVRVRRGTQRACERRREVVALRCGEGVAVGRVARLRRVRGHARLRQTGVEFAAAPILAGWSRAGARRTAACVPVHAARRRGRIARAVGSRRACVPATRGARLSLATTAAATTLVTIRVDCPCTARVVGGVRSIAVQARAIGRSVGRARSVCRWTVPSTWAVSTCSWIWRMFSGGRGCRYLRLSNGCRHAQGGGGAVG